MIDGIIKSFSRTAAEWGRRQRSSCPWDYARAKGDGNSICYKGTAREPVHGKIKKTKGEQVEGRSQPITRRSERKTFFAI